MSEYIVEMPKEPVKVVRDGWNVRIEWQYKQREEIVRCRDCTGMVETWDGYECERFSGEYHRADPDGYCAWGERRNDG